MPMMTRSERSFFLIVFALMMTDFIGSLEVSMIFGALPSVNRIYGDPTTVGWLITGFVLVQAAAAAVGGRLGDIFGRRRVLEITMLISIAGSLLSAVSHDLLWIIVGRCLQGVSGAILPLSFGIIRDNASTRRAALGTGMVLGAYAISGGLGFIVGGYFADIGHWNWIFYISSILPAAAIMLNRLVIPADPASPEKTPHIDYIGATGLVAAVAAILIGISLSRNFGWLSAVTLLLVFGGVAGLACWAQYELRHATPLINLHRLRDRRYLFTLLSFFLIGCGGQQMALITLSLLQQPTWTGIGLGLTGSLAGVAKLPSNIAGVFAGPAGGRIAQMSGGRITGICGATILFAAWAVLYFFHGSLVLVISCAAASTAGLTIMFVATPAIVMETTPAAEMGEATGFAYLVRALGMGVGTQVVSLLLGSSKLIAPTDHAVYSAPAAFELAISFVAITSFMALLLAIAIPRRRDGDVEREGAEQSLQNALQ
jgi:MFS family permease